MKAFAITGVKETGYVEKDERPVGAGEVRLKVDYVECVDAETLEPRRRIEKGCCVLVAAYCGKTRLIDNVVV